MYDVTVIGPAVIDILASPFDMEAVMAGSRDLEKIRMSFGGDALNEAVVLTRLGKKVQLISKVGDDTAGRRVLSYLEENGISTDSICVQPGLDTAINIALIEKDGSRRFLMNPHSSLRKLGPPDVLPRLEEAAGIVSFASMFISPLFTIEKMGKLFSQIKESGRRLAVDVTRAKNGETIRQIRPLLPFMDVFFPNDEEIASLTGIPDPEWNVRLLVQKGVGTAVVKTGREGCIVGWREEGRKGAHPQPVCTDPEGCVNRRMESVFPQIRTVRVPAVPEIMCIDTTGAGDSFAAAFLGGMCDGMDRLECARLGCAAASCSIEEIGATDGVRSQEQVLERYSRIPKECGKAP